MKRNLFFRIVAAVLAAAVMLAASCLCGCGGNSVSIVAEGKMDNIRWVLEDDGCLSFTGTGTLPGVEYILSTETGLSETVRPKWYEHRDKVTDIIVGANIDGVSMNAFMNFANLKTIDISATVKHIDGYAVTGCPSLERIIIRAGDVEMEKFCIGYTGGTAEAALSKVTFEGVRGSETEAYAKGCGAKFSAL